ncbi:hypothetical protein ACS0TY_006460 [Phlomoides rotata]
MTKNLEQVVNMVLNSFQHPHPCVRWAAINATAMNDFQNPQVQAHAAAAAASASAVLKIIYSLSGVEMLLFILVFESFSLEVASKVQEGNKYGMSLSLPERCFHYIRVRVR